ncbi:uncharacterized protein J3R85_004105 [Psidium guajava]|nr:uncharacterized protein J3R85_004105 [Psidium guajava]
MYKCEGRMHDAISQRKPAPSPSSSLSSSLSLSSNPQPSHADGQHRHLGPSSDPQKHIKGQLGHMQTECTLVPSPSVQHSNDEGNIGEEDRRFMICPYEDS